MASKFFNITIRDNRAKIFFTYNNSASTGLHVVEPVNAYLMQFHSF